MRTRKIVDIVLLALVVLAGVFIWQHRQQIYDFGRLYNYQVPTAISQLSSDIALTPLGQNAFYVNHPELLADRTKFNKKCSQQEQTIVLGCYHSKQRGIFLFDITDQRLQGVEQVTAAHEMLHAVYDRLGDKERAELDKQLQDFYKQVRDQRIIDTVNAYKQSEPTELVNEMHSVFGSEIAQLPPALEKHYQRYFKDRQKVVAFSEKYKAEFANRQQIVVAYDAQLASLLMQIGSAESTVTYKKTGLDQMRSLLENTRTAGDIGAYNRQVLLYNSQVNDYNASVDALRALVAQYNELVAKRNAIALEERELVQAIDSHATPVQAQ